MLLEKYENVLVSVKQLVKKSGLASSISLGQTVWCVKKQMLMLFEAKLGIFRIQQELSKTKFNPIPFKS